jgi:hypothetical protein
MKCVKRLKLHACKIIRVRLPTLPSVDLDDSSAIILCDSQVLTKRGVWRLKLSKYGQ